MRHSNKDPGLISDPRSVRDGDGGGCGGNTRPKKTTRIRPTYREVPRPGTAMMAVISTAKTKFMGMALASFPMVIVFHFFICGGE